MTTLVRAALARLKPKIILLEVCGVPVLAALAAVWLQIPESHVWQFAASMVFGLAILLGALLLQSTVLRWIRNAGAGGSAWRGMGLLALITVVWCALGTWAGLLSVHVDERAAFWNSRLSPHQRTIFTYQHLIVWQNDALSTLLWFVLPSLLLPFLVETVCRGLRSAWPTILRVYRRWQLWLTVGLAGFVATWLVEKLITYHPSETARGELMSFAIRLGALYLTLSAIVLITLAIVAELLSRADSSRTRSIPVSEAPPAPSPLPEHP